MTIRTGRIERKVERLIPALETSDGAGVRILRSLGQSASTRLDPFLMLDEFGSASADDYIAGFPAHPHRGFETVTYMLDGHMLHEDHLGNRGDLRSGDVQWMTAGRGIIHSEMPQQEAGVMRGFQLWLNLPAKEKMSDPSYRDIASDSIPSVAFAGGTVKVIAGHFEQDGQRTDGAIVGRSTQPYYLDVHLHAGARFEHSIDTGHNAAIYVYEGQVTIAHPQGDTVVTSGNLAVLGPGERVVIEQAPAPASQSARLLLLAAKPIGEPVVQYGPFVMNTRAEIEAAINDYQAGVLTGEQVRTAAKQQPSGARE